MNPLLTKSIIIIAVISILVACAILYNRMGFSGIVSGMQNLQKSGAPQTFSYDGLKGLPQPVQRYFRHVLRDGQKYIASVSLKHSGLFKTGVDKDWVNITGEQYYTAFTPGFIWRGKTSMFHAWDSYIGGKGNLKVFILGFIRIMNGEGPAFDQGELLRWLGECVWFPTALLPSENLSWAPIDSNRAKLTYRYNGIEVYYDVTFNEAGEIVSFETMRYMNGEKMERWAGVCGQYKEINGVKIPVEIEGMWRLSTGDFSYARFKIEEIAYKY